MKIRMKRWEEEINQLKTDIASALSKPSMPPSTKTKFEPQMNKDEEENLKDREEAIRKIKETYELESKSNATQFLLKYSEDGDSDNDEYGNRRDNTRVGRGNNSKNWWGPRPRGRPRGRPKY